MEESHKIRRLHYGIRWEPLLLAAGIVTVVIWVARASVTLASLIVVLALGGAAAFAAIKSLRSRKQIVGNLGGPVVGSAEIGSCDIGGSVGGSDCG